MMIDSHHHFWTYSAEEYGWIGEGMDVLKRSFGPADLEAAVRDTGIEGVISVQARTSEAETRYLLDQAKQSKLVKGVVGWLDLTQPTVEQSLEQLANEPLVRGFRHVLQGEADDRYMLREDFNKGVAKLHDYGFAYDILIYHRHLPHVPEFVKQHPGLIFILDHVAKPKIETDVPDPLWVKGMKDAAARGNVFCKISGMVTEVVPGVKWTPALLRPYFEAALEAFGAGRVMFGSDWPVCLLGTDYGTWARTVKEWVSPLSADEQAAILGGNALRAYGLAF